MNACSEVVTLESKSYSNRRADGQKRKRWTLIVSAYTLSMFGVENCSRYLQIHAANGVVYISCLMFFEYYFMYRK